MSSPRTIGTGAARVAVTVAAAGIALAAAGRAAATPHTVPALAADGGRHFSGVSASYYSTNARGFCVGEVRNDGLTTGFPPIITVAFDGGGDPGEATASVLVTQLNPGDVAPFQATGPDDATSCRIASVVVDHGSVTDTPGDPPTQLLPDQAYSVAITNDTVQSTGARTLGLHVTNLSPYAFNGVELELSFRDADGVVRDVAALSAGDYEDALQPGASFDAEYDVGSGTPGASPALKVEARADSASTLALVYRLPPTAVAGHVVAATATLNNLGTPVAGRVVALVRDIPGAAPVTEAEGTTDGAGVVHLSYVARVNGAYRFVVLGSAPIERAGATWQSSQYVRPAFTLHRTRGHITGTELTLTRGDVVVLQEKAGSHWVTVASTKTGPKGAFAFGVRPKGTYRVTTRATALHLAGIGTGARL